TGVGGTVAAEVLIGGGLNLVKYGDNGVGRWGSLDLSGCAVAVQQSCLYGHQFDNVVCQANVLGFTSADYTLETVLHKPYFENNLFDIVSRLYIRGTVQSPLMNLTGTYNIRISLSGNPSYDENLVIIKDLLAGLRTDVAPATNPGSRT